MCAKNYENWLTTDKVMGIMDEVFWITVYDHTSYKETTTIIPTSELTMADKKNADLIKKITLTVLKLIAYMLMVG